MAAGIDSMFYTLPSARAADCLVGVGSVRRRYRTLAQLEAAVGRSWLQLSGLWSGNWGLVIAVW